MSHPKYLVGLRRPGLEFLMIVLITTSEKRVRVRAKTFSGIFL